MDTTNGNEQRQRPPEQEFFGRVSAMANRQLSAILGSDKGKQAAYKIAMAMLSAMRTSKTPRTFLDVTETSIADCIATSYETGLHPGGPNAVVYLVPQAPRQGAQPELQWRITHRGLAILAARAGFGILAVPVSKTDRLVVSFGEAIEHESDPAAWPETLADLQGCILVVRRISDGIVIARPWMPLAAIDQRRKKARDQNVWNEWPIEQAQKTVIKWAFARGYVPVDSIELREALSADTKGEIIDVAAQTMGTQPAPGNGREALGLRSRGPERPAITEDTREQHNYTEEARRLDEERERVPAEEAPVVTPRAAKPADPPLPRRPRYWQERASALGYPYPVAEAMDPVELRRVIEGGIRAPAVAGGAVEPTEQERLGGLGWTEDEAAYMSPAARGAVLAGEWTPQTHQVGSGGSVVPL